jgi:uncharacterized protein
MDTRLKYENLKEILHALGRVVVCYSGGVDSTLLVRAALDALGAENVLALIARSPTYPESEIAQAVAFCESVGVPFDVIGTDEMGDESFLENSKERCYYCKRHLFGTAGRIARQKGFQYVAEGSNVDDRGDYRPGRRAGAELAVQSPLDEAGLTKAEIRAISAELGLPTYDKPSLACLASRIPYGTRIDAALLEQIGRAEQVLQDLGMGQVRVRYHGQVARIEGSEDDFDRVMQHKEEIAEALTKLGFLYVTLDLKGYRTGSMNEGLDDLE